jgi:hypothetical protein
MDCKLKFNFIYEMVKDNMEKLDKGEITVEQATAMAKLSNQANNVMLNQLNVAKFVSNTNNAEKILKNVGL